MLCYDLPVQTRIIEDRLVKNFLVLCHSYKLGLTEGQGAVGAKRGGSRMGSYADDERQSPRPPGPRSQGWPETGHLRRRNGSMGLRTRFSPLTPCIWPVSGQSTPICSCDRALGRDIDIAGVLCRRLRTRP